MNFTKERLGRGEVCKAHTRISVLGLFAWSLPGFLGVSALLRKLERGCKGKGGRRL
jgi:hypothetical protein